MASNFAYANQIRLRPAATDNPIKASQPRNAKRNGRDKKNINNNNKQQQDRTKTKEREREQITVVFHVGSSDCPQRRSISAEYLFEYLLRTRESTETAQRTPSVVVDVAPSVNQKNQTTPDFPKQNPVEPSKTQ